MAIFGFIASILCSVFCLYNSIPAIAMANYSNLPFWPYCCLAGAIISIIGSFMFWKAKPSAKTFLIISACCFLLYVIEFGMSGISALFVMSVAYALPLFVDIILLCLAFMKHEKSTGEA